MSDMAVRKMLALTVGLLLAGCQAPTPEQKNQVDDGSAAALNTINAIEPVPENDSAQIADRSGIIADKHIPPAFLGRWGLVPADCTSTAGDNKGLMTVAPDRLSFYESRATITRLEGVSSTELRATLAFSGEGQQWTEDTPLTLEENGNVLTRVADGQTLRYTRCAA